MELSVAYNPNYYAIDDILATQERTPCRFMVNVAKLGDKLNPSSDERDVKAGTVLELPMWLVLELSSGRHPIVTPDLPKVYKESYREILKADPCAVDLHKFGLYFYELGLYAKRFDRRGDVADILTHTFKTRFRQLMDLADNTIADPTVQNKLDMLERHLFRDAHEARTKLNLWLEESDCPLEAAAMVINHKKRKRINMEETS